MGAVALANMCPAAETVRRIVRCTASDAICGFSVGVDALGDPLKQFGISFVKRRDTRPRPTVLRRRIRPRKSSIFMHDAQNWGVIVQYGESQKSS